MNITELLMCDIEDEKGNSVIDFFGFIAHLVDMMLPFATIIINQKKNHILIYSPEGNILYKNNINPEISVNHPLSDFLTLIFNKEVFQTNFFLY